MDNAGQASLANKVKKKKRTGDMEESTGGSLLSITRVEALKNSKAVNVTVGNRRQTRKDWDYTGCVGILTNLNIKDLEDFIALFNSFHPIGD